MLGDECDKSPSRYHKNRWDEIKSILTVLK
jgi:hypothetical protein